MTANDANRWFSSVFRSRPMDHATEVLSIAVVGPPPTPLLTKPIVTELSSQRPLPRRVFFLKQLSALLQNYTLTDVTDVWATVDEEFLSNSNSSEARHAAYEFMIACIKIQYDELGMVRAAFYSAIKRDAPWEDLDYRLDALSALTKDGRDIAVFEKNIIRLLSSWLISILDRKPIMTSTDTPVPHLQKTVNLLANVLKFNFSFVEESEITELLTVIQRTFLETSNTADKQSCLNMLDMLIRYSFIPSAGLETYVRVLCEGILIASLNQPSQPPQPSQPSQSSQPTPWSIFQILLQSHLRLSAIWTLCKILDNSDQITRRVTSLRGAIVLMGRVAWDRNRLIDPSQIPNSVLLLSMRNALKGGDRLVNLEVLRNMNMLIERNERDEISLIDWDILIDILEDLGVSVLEGGTSGVDVVILDTGGDETFDIGSFFISNETSTAAAAESLWLVHAYSRFIFRLQLLYNMSALEGPVSRFFSILHKQRRHLPLQTITLLLDYYEKELVLLPPDEEWLTTLSELMETFYQNPSIDQSVRLRTLSMTTEIYTTIKDFYQDEVIGRVIMPVLSGLTTEHDFLVAKQAVELLVLVLKDCGPSWFETLLGVLKEASRCHCNLTSNLPPTSIRINIPSKAPLSSISQNSSSASSPTSFPASPSLSPLGTPVFSGSTFSNDGTASQSTTAALPLVCPAMHAAKGLTNLFEYALYRPNGARCVDIFSGMIDVIKPGSVHSAPRLEVLGRLMSLRCNPDHRVFVTDEDIGPTSSLFDKLVGLQKHGAEPPLAMNPAAALHGFERKPRASLPEPSRLESQLLPDRKKSVTERIFERRMSMKDSGLGSIKPPFAHFTHSNLNQSISSTISGGDISTTTTLGTMHETSHTSSTIPKRHSPYVVTYIDKSMSEQIQSMRAVLPISKYLDAIHSLIFDEKEWEVYSFALLRLPIQLSNKHLFCGATSQLQELRKKLCEVLVQNKFADNVVKPPPRTTRTDMSVLGYQVLTILISYRRIFTKRDQDELVSTFSHGLQKNANTARPCIHALTVCCHELPLSVAKILGSNNPNSILIKLSQIMSTSTVSGHILEFLSGLARLPNVYSSFTNDDYKRVLGIALQYLKYSHTQTAHSSQFSNVSNSNISGTPSSTAGTQGLGLSSSHLSSHQLADNALSQYVLIMAYYVITIWYMVTPVSDRRKQLGYLIRGLLLANQPSKQVDEQTITCLDMLARFTYANFEQKPQRSVVSEILLGDKVGKDKITTKTWLYGLTLFTLRTAKSTPWIEVTIRRCSGTVSFLCRVENPSRTEYLDFQSLPSLLMAHYNPDIIEVLAATDVGVPKTESVDTDVNVETSVDYNIEEPDSLASNSRSTSQIPMLDEDLDNVETSDKVLTSNSENRHMSEGVILSQTTSAQYLHEPLRASPTASQISLVDTLVEEESSLSMVSPATTSDVHNRKHPNKIPQRIRNLPDSERDMKHISGSESDNMSELSERAQRIQHDILSEKPNSTNSGAALRKDDARFDPAFVLLQFTSYPMIGMEPPILLPDDETTQRMISVFDRTPVVDFNKIGVVYVAKGQTTETEILQNTHGSPDYVQFLNSLGDLVRLKGLKSYYTGGLDTEYDTDGLYAYCCKDDVGQTIFHTATLMPTNLEHDPQCSLKKRHIGNDFVTIVYNDSGLDYSFNTIPSQFNFVNIIVSPHSEDSSKFITQHATASSISTGTDNTFFKVHMLCRPDMPPIGPINEFKMVSASTLGPFVRQMALHANIFAQVFLQSRSGQQEYVSNWKDRLRQLKRLQQRVLENAERSNPSTALGAGQKNESPLPGELEMDFTRYT